MTYAIAIYFFLWLLRLAFLWRAMDKCAFLIAIHDAYHPEMGADKFFHLYEEQFPEPSFLECEPLMWIFMPLDILVMTALLRINRARV